LLKLFPNSSAVVYLICIICIGLAGKMPTPQDLTILGLYNLGA